MSKLKTLKDIEMPDEVRKVLRIAAIEWVEQKQAEINVPFLYYSRHIADEINVVIDWIMLVFNLTEDDLKK